MYTKIQAFHGYSLPQIMACIRAVKERSADFNDATIRYKCNRCKRYCRIRQTPLAAMSTCCHGTTFKEVKFIFNGEEKI